MDPVQISTTIRGVKHASELFDKILKGVSKTKDREIISDITELQKEYILIQSEQNTITLENEKLKEENKQLRNQLDSTPIYEGGTLQLKPEQIKIIKEMFKSQNLEFTLRAIASFLETNENTARYHLDVLMEEDLVYCSQVLSLGGGNSRPTPYSLSKAGRAYLMDNNLT